ncbi:MAG: hypothetical protein ACLFU2_11015, partial [Opitutales bacterium]
MHCRLCRFPGLLLLVACLPALSAQTTSWTLLAPSPTGERIVGIAHDGTTFGMVTSNNVNGGALRSSDGINWTEARIAPTGTTNGGDYQDIAYGNGVWVIVGRRAAGPVILSSTDLVTWTDRTPVPPATPIAGDLYSVIWDGGQFVAVGGTTGAATVATSPDGLNWTGSNPTVAVVLHGIATNGARLVAVGTNGLILYSDNGGGAWTTIPATTADHLHDVAHANGLFVAAGTNGRVLTSSDGAIWTQRTSGTADILHTVEAISSPTPLFLASGTNGRIIESADGVTWTTVSTPTGDTLHGLAYGSLGDGEGRFVAGGQVGQLIYSGALGGGAVPGPDPVTVQPVNPPATWPATGATGTLQITVANGPAAWSATSSVPWVTFTTSASGTQSATLRFALAANSSGLPRAGTITVTGPATPFVFDLQQAAAPPPAPRIFPYMWSITGNVIACDWDPVEGATGYRVERSTEGPSGPWTTVATLPPGETAYTESGLAWASVYYYRVFAANPAGESPPSSVWGGVLGPAPVTDLTARSLNHFEIELSWTDVPGAALYILEQRPLGETRWSFLESVAAG